MSIAVQKFVNILSTLGGSSPLIDRESIPPQSALLVATAGPFKVLSITQVGVFVDIDRDTFLAPGSSTQFVTDGPGRVKFIGAKMKAVVLFAPGIDLTVNSDLPYGQKLFVNGNEFSDYPTAEVTKDPWSKVQIGFIDLVKDDVLSAGCANLFNTADLRCRQFYMWVLPR